MFNVSSNKAIRLAVWCVLGIAFQASAWACEPASMDWSAFMHLNDANRDGLLQRSELVHPDFSGQSYERFEQDPATISAFADLDRNRDGHLSQEEWIGLYRYLPNPCAGWPWH